MADPFEKKAATWDTRRKQEMTENILKKILEHAPLKPEMTVLDYGAGTGLISLKIAPNVKKVVAVDQSREMLKMLERKQSATSLNNIEVVHGDLERGELNIPKVDMIITSMTFHHMENISLAVDHFQKLLKEEGFLAVADLEKESGDFHADKTGVYHSGFEKEELSEILEARGFAVLICERVERIAKVNKRGEKKEYPVFLIVARKNTP
jgi:ubiquinone/menaquinone biosynthesis C-methylase UbiE